MISLFEEYGEVNSAKIITDRATGRSKGYGFVEMKNDDEAKRAISELNGAELEGRTLVVNEAHEKKDSHERNSGNRNFRSRRNY